MNLYEPDGPTLERFLVSNKRIRGLMGPIGSGKTLCALIEMWIRAQQQAAYPPDQKNGERIRPSRWYVLRDTYRNLEKVIDDWKEAVTMYGIPGKFTGGNNEPGVQKVRARRPDGTIIQTSFHFMAIGEANLEQLFRGLKPTGILLEEMDTLPSGTIDYAQGRVGRYPRVMMDDAGNIVGEPTWRGVWGTCNAPNVDNWVYDRFVENLPDDWDFFTQPSGFSPNAENLKYLDGGQEYYFRQRKLDKFYVRRMIENKFGYSRAGKVVHDEFDYERHVSTVPIEVLPGKQITIGLDAGRTPSAVAVQRDYEWQLRYLRELVCEDFDAKKFGEFLSRWLAREFPGAGSNVFRFVADPNAFNPTESSDLNWVEIVERTAKIKVHPAKTNNVDVRLAAVNAAITRPMRDGKYGLIVDPSCKVLIRGFVSEYKYRKINSNQGERFDEKPDKHVKASHPHDAGQYAAMEESDDVELGLRARGREQRRERAAKARSQRSHPHSWLTRGAA